MTAGSNNRIKDRLLSTGEGGRSALYGAFYSVKRLESDPLAAVNVLPDSR